MKISLIVGVLVGGVLSLVASNLLSIPLVIHAINETRGDNSDYAVINFIKADAFLFFIQILIDIVSSILAGYVAAWISKEKELIVGTLSSFLSVGFAAFHLFSGFYTAFELSTIFDIFITPFFGLFGGYVRYRQTSQLTK
jgi:hypothetical protein